MVQQHCEFLWIRIFSWMFTIVCCSVIGLGLGWGLDSVAGLFSGYAHVFVLLSVAIGTLPIPYRLLLLWPGWTPAAFPGSSRATVSSVWSFRFLDVRPQPAPVEVLPLRVEYRRWRDPAAPCSDTGSTAQWTARPRPSSPGPKRVLDFPRSGTSSEISPICGQCNN